MGIPAHATDPRGMFNLRKTRRDPANIVPGQINQQRILEESCF